MFSVHNQASHALSTSVVLTSTSYNTQLFSFALPADLGTLIIQTEMCVEHVEAWMDSNTLKLNSDKTEALMVGTCSRTSVSCDEHLKIGSSLIPFQPKLKNLGVVLGSSLTMSITLALSVLSCAESVPSVHSSRQE